MSDKRCKICDQTVYQNYKLISSDKLWYHCACGYMFHDKVTNSEEVYTQERADKLKGIKSYEDRTKYFARVYGPIVEERIYGRRLLDVGYGNDTLMKTWEERGWVVSGIDIFKNDYITGDFETYDFWKNEHERYDMIWMSDVLQCFQDPVKAIYKAYNLLNPNGILFIVTPNTAVIRRNSIISWGHWDQDENKQFISYKMLEDVLARCDESLSGKASVIYKDEYVTSKRFITYSNMHVMVQKQKIEEYVKMPEVTFEAAEAK